MTRLRLFADYHQIHVFDPSSVSDLGDAWTAEAVADDVAVAEDAVALGTRVSVNVDVEVELHESEPADDSLDFDHVVEASLRAPSGQVVVMGCTDYAPDATRFPIAAGEIRLRASRRNLAAAVEAGIASDEKPETMEQMRIQLWSSPHLPTQVTKRWPGPA